MSFHRLTMSCQRCAMLKIYATADTCIAWFIILIEISGIYRGGGGDGDLMSTNHLSYC